MSDYAKVPSAGQSDTLITVNDDKKAAEKPVEGGICAPWKWFMAKPWERWPFLIFLAFGALTVLWLIMYFTSGFTGYLLAGVAAIIMSLYGANHFRVLLGLKEQVDKLHKLNQNFRSENAALSQEVDKLQRAREQLTGVEQNLKESNQKLKDNLKKFAELDKRLKSLGDSNIEGLDKLTQSTESMMNQWKESLIKHEKSILNKVYDEFEYADDKADMSKDEFNKFIRALPQEYQDQFAQLGKTFEDFAGDDDVMDYDEFTKLVDTWVEDIALGNVKQM